MLPDYYPITAVSIMFDYDDYDPFPPSYFITGDLEHNAEQ
jgi:hypothetical protein